MTQYWYDALYPAGIPLTIEADAVVLSYVDHPEVHPAPMLQLAQRFPNHRQMSISAHNSPADVCDVERGAMTPDQVPQWCTDRRAEGRDPICYCAPATWPVVQSYCRAALVVIPHWWQVIRQQTPTITGGAIANQYLGAGPYDKSIVAPGWPIPVPPIIPVATEEDVPTIFTNTTTTDPGYGASFIDYGGGYAPTLDQLAYETEIGLGTPVKGVDAYTWQRLLAGRNAATPVAIKDYTAPPATPPAS